MQRDFSTSIKENGIIPRGGLIILGLSGGPDSTCLFHILANLREEMGYSLVAAHLNHSLRGKHSDEDEAYSKKISDFQNIPFFTNKLDVKAYARQHKLTDEEAGRECRYEFFSEVACKYKLEKGYRDEEVYLAIAHNAEDVVETVLMRILRGTGVYGLPGIEPTGTTKDKLKIIRPLIYASRSDIEAYNLSHGLCPRIDHTNSENDYTRNRLRNELLPQLKAEYNPQIYEAILRLSDLSRIDNDFLEKIAKEEYNKLIKSTSFCDKTSLAVEINALRALHPAIKTRLIRLMAYRLGLVQDFTHKHMEGINALIDRGETNSGLDLPHGFVVRTEYDKLYIINDKIKISTQISKQIPIATASFNLDFEIISKLEYESQKLASLDKSETSDILFLDLDALRLGREDVYETEIYLRHRKDGDRFAPRGMTGHKKLSDVFIDAKISRHKRNEVPLLVYRDEVIWILGFRKSRSYVVHKDSENILKVVALP